MPATEARSANAFLCPCAVALGLLPWEFHGHPPPLQQTASGHRVVEEEEAPVWPRAYAREARRSSFTLGAEARQIGSSPSSSAASSPPVIPTNFVLSSSLSHARDRRLRPPRVLTPHCHLRVLLLLKFRESNSRIGLHPSSSKKPPRHILLCLATAAPFHEDIFAGGNLHSSYANAPVPHLGEVVSSGCLCGLCAGNRRESRPSFLPPSALSTPRGCAMKRCGELELCCCCPALNQQIWGSPSAFEVPVASTT